MTEKITLPNPTRALIREGGRCIFGLAIIIIALTIVCGSVSLILISSGGVP
jgi:hypothetical protein